MARQNIQDWKFLGSKFLFWLVAFKQEIASNNSLYCCEVTRGLTIPATLFSFEYDIDYESVKMEKKASSFITCLQVPFTVSGNR